jgi:23S rRNA (uracil1939-C5)-methyltransferase
LARNKHYGKVFHQVEIKRAGSQGYAIGLYEERVILIKYGAPGDIVDVRINGKKKKTLLGEIVHFHKKSEDRVEPFCQHFGSCGGCKWQHISYEAQLKHKSIDVQNAFDRIGHLTYDNIEPIIGSEQNTFYRNKMEFSFCNSRWLTQEQIDETAFIQQNALGFHAPGRFDKVVHIEKCWLQDDLTNEVRNYLYAYAQEKEYSFFDHRGKNGFLRSLMVRKSTLNQWMVLLVFGEPGENIPNVMQDLCDKFPQLTSVFYAINQKENDSLYDLEMIRFSGSDYLEETLLNLKFTVRPKSFFQTNPRQAEVLYQKALDLGQVESDQLVYDLYCGTGTITLFLAQSAQKVIGIESVPQAIEDAWQNAERNKIDNIDFIVGDMKDILNEDFMIKHGRPDVVFTDPPRAGMHPKVVENLLLLKPEKIVYISCNPATQARDLSLMEEEYIIKKVQPVDMFPHTYHVENITLLERKNYGSES